MDGAMAALKEKLNQLLKEAAQVSVALDRGDGTITGVPHYSVIEARAHELGQQLSREIQARQMGELVAGRMATAPCPECRARCELEPQRTHGKLNRRPCRSTRDGRLLPDLSPGLFPPTERRWGLMPAN